MQYAADKRPVKTPRAPMGSLRVGAPGDCIATDYLGPFPVTERDHRYVLLFTNHFTKNVEIIPVSDMTAEVCATKLLKEVISKWGCPLAVHSYQGRTFESKVFRELCRMLEVRKTRTSVRNPRGNGQVERFKRTLLRMIKGTSKTTKVQIPLLLLDTQVCFVSSRRSGICTLVVLLVPNAQHQMSQLV